MTECEALNLFRDWLNEVYEDVDICGLSYVPSIALEAVDPIAFNEAFSDWIDLEGIEVEY